MNDLDVALHACWEAQYRRSGVELRKQIGSSLGVVTSMNGIPLWEAHNARSTGEVTLKKNGGESLRSTQALHCPGS